MTILKKETTNSDISIFEIYVAKLKNHSENTNTWERSALTINTLFLGVVALLSKDKIGDDGSDLYKVIQQYEVIFLILSFLGLVISASWLVAQIDSIRWQDRMNKILKSNETELLNIPEDHGMWTMITTTTENKWTRMFDMAYVKAIIPISFILFWCTLIYVSITQVL